MAIMTRRKGEKGVVNVVEKRIGKKKKHRSNTQSKIPEFYVKNPNWKKSRSLTQIHYIIREITREKRESHSGSVFTMTYRHTSISNHNDGASPFIEN